MTRLPDTITSHDLQPAALCGTPVGRVLDPLDGHHIQTLGALHVPTLAIACLILLDALRTKGRGRNLHQDLLLLEKVLLQITRGILMCRNNDWTSMIEN